MTFNWNKVLFYINGYTVLDLFVITGNFTGDDAASFCSSLSNQVILLILFYDKDFKLVCSAMSCHQATKNGTVFCKKKRKKKERAISV